MPEVNAFQFQKQIAKTIAGRIERGMPLHKAFLSIQPGYGKITILHLVSELLKEHAEKLKQSRQTMKRQQTAALLPIIKAFGEGKTIEMRRYPSDKWIEIASTPDSELAWHAQYEYRVKPEPVVLYVRHCLSRPHDHNSSSEDNDMSLICSECRIYKMVSQP